MALVYRAINRHNGHDYIGITRQTLKQRRNMHHWDAKKARTAFARALLKYGQDAFEWEILADKLDLMAAVTLECRLIKERRPYYNMTNGGEGWASAHCRPVISINDSIVFESARAASRTTGISPSRVMQLCRFGGETTRGFSFRYADSDIVVKRSRSADELINLRKRQDVGLLKAIATTSKPVICLNDGIEYPSISAASRAYGLHVSAISAAIYRRGSAAGKKFEFIK